MLVDAVGTCHVPATNGARIVSLVPSLTELLFDLALGEQLVGRTGYCVHPADAVAAVAEVGGTKQPDLARIGGLGATHVLMNVDENRREDAQALAEMGIVVVATHPLHPLDNPPLYRLLGALFDRRAQAEALATSFHQAYDALLEQRVGATERRVLYLIWRKPYMSVSTPTYISRMLALVGLRTVPEGSEQRYPRIDLDAGLARGLDWILLSSEPFPFADKHRTEIEDRLHAAMPGETLPRITFIDGEMMSWYGSRAISGLRYLGRFARCLDDIEAGRRTA
ncbi:MAG: ABC transporter substrate-binding protein, partial [Gammaproteobacteria bacterium]|nr:ABC transporter substrate-binding protein [Gammaproteobacteria bacterium]